MPELPAVSGNTKIPRQDEQADEPGIGLLRRRREMRRRRRLLLWCRHAFLLYQQMRYTG
jgi:hypothetical protein